MDNKCSYSSYSYSYSSVSWLGFDFHLITFVFGKSEFRFVVHFIVFRVLLMWFYIVLRSEHQLFISVSEPFLLNHIICYLGVTLMIKC